MTKMIITALLLAGVCMAQEKPTPKYMVIGQPRAFIFGRDATEPIVEITVDGKVTFGKDYNPDAAAELFWTSLGEASPRKLKARIAELEAELTTIKAQREPAR